MCVCDTRLLYAVRAVLTTHSNQRTRCVREGGLAAMSFWGRKEDSPMFTLLGAYATCHIHGVAPARCLAIRAAHFDAAVARGQEKRELERERVLSRVRLLTALFHLSAYRVSWHVLYFALLLSIIRQMRQRARPRPQNPAQDGALEFLSRGR